MRTRMICSIAVAVIVTAGCGGDDGGGLDGDQAEVADLLQDEATASGIELDRRCVDEIMAEMSDADARLILDAGPDGDPAISPEGEALGDEIISCIDTDSLVDSIVADLGDENIDVDCLRNELKALDPEALVSGDLPDTVFECFRTGD